MGEQVTKKNEEPIAINLRLSADLIAIVDQVAQRLSADSRGVPVTRVDAIRIMLRDAGKNILKPIVKEKGA